MSRYDGVECRVDGCAEQVVSARGLCTTHLLDMVDNGGPSDEMIARASIPDAAALLKQATRRGLISPVSGYAHSKSA